MRRRWTRAATTLAVLMVSACAVIPSSGPVTKAGDDRGLGESTVRYSPARPTPGASPEQIVSGYLDAMLAFPVSSRTAGAFLTSEAAASWSPASGVRVYSDSDILGPGTSEQGRNNPRSDLRSPVAVRLGFLESARLDRQGHYVPQGGRAAITYRLERVDGEWRIANPQVGVLVNQKFFEDYFRPFNLFNFDLPGKRLVPDPVYLVVGDQLATSLVTSLSAGSRSVDLVASRTYVPGLRDLRPSVPVSSDGVADVEFTEDFSDLSGSARDRLSAQIVWTLRQVPGIDAVQVVGGTTSLTVNGSEVQPISSWGGYGPNAARGHAYGVVDDKVVQIYEGVAQTLSGAWGRDAHGAIFVGVSGAGVAGVMPQRDEVRITNRNGAQVREVGGTGFVPPWWDSGGTLWLVDRDAAGTRVRAMVDGDIRSLDAGGLADTDVQTFAISPDDARYAVSSSTSGGRIYVGQVLRDAKDKLLGLGPPTQVRTSAVGPAAATWSSITGLGLLADTDSGRQVFTTQIDGSSTADIASAGRAMLPDVDAQTLAIGAGEIPDLYVSDARKRLWYLPANGSWRQVTIGPLTGLSYGR